MWLIYPLKQFPELLLFLTFLAMTHWVSTETEKNLRNTKYENIFYHFGSIKMWTLLKILRKFFWFIEIIIQFSIVKLTIFCIQKVTHSNAAKNSVYIQSFIFTKFCMQWMTHQKPLIRVSFKFLYFQLPTTMQRQRLLF